LNVVSDSDVWTCEDKLFHAAGQAIEKACSILRLKGGYTLCKADAEDCSDRHDTFCMHNSIVILFVFVIIVLIISGAEC